MQKDTPYPTYSNPLRILNLEHTLIQSPIVMPNAVQANLPPLSYLLVADRLGELYEMAFPDKAEWLQEKVAWQNVADVATATEKFLNRVSTLFPVYAEFWDEDLEVIEWRLWEIPVMPLGYDIWYDDWDDLKEPAPYLLHMLYSRRDEFSFGRRSDFQELYPKLQVPKQLELQRLIETLRQMLSQETLSEPLKSLPDLILMLEHNTGNFWLDVGECALADSGGYPPWTAENVILLTAAWQEAQPIQDGVQQLLDWQNDTSEGIHSKLTVIRELLLTAYQKNLACAVESD